MNQSPLRYPGGKSRIAPLIGLILKKLNFNSATYIEPFAGGAGVAIKLLLNGDVDKIVINDFDKAIYSFWRAIKEEANAFINLIENTPVTIEEWYRQKNIYINCNSKYSLELGFAAFFLNRTNRSGILNEAGPIGGFDQKGNYLIDARFNKTNLIARIRAIAEQKNKIFVYNKEVRKFITQIIPQHQNNALVYFDPPYFQKGKKLYKNFFNANDHQDIAKAIESLECDWIVTYDDTQQIRDIYKQCFIKQFNLNYSAAVKRKGLELMIFQNANICPTLEEISKAGIQFRLMDTGISK